MGPHRAAIADGIRQISYFAQLPEGEVQRLAQDTTVVVGDDGMLLFEEGQPAAGLYCVLQGRVAVVRDSPEGRRLIVREFRSGETFNEVGALDATTNNASAVMDADGTEVLLIAGRAVRDLATRYPTLGNEMMQAMAQKLRFAMTRMNRIATMDVKARLCARLLETVDDDGLLTGMSQEDLAARLGTVRQVIGRALAELRKAGIVEVGRGYIKVLDRDALQRLVQ